MNSYIKYIIITIFFIGTTTLAQDAKVSVEFGDKNVVLGKTFSIKVTIPNSEDRNVQGFPDIMGFKKRGIEGKSMTNNVGVKTITSQQVIQTYIAEHEGNFRLPPFVLQVNGQGVKSDGLLISVLPEKTNNIEKSADFQDFIDNTAEFLDVKEEAFLALRTNKTRMFVGEGFGLKLAFYVAETNAAEMDFTDDLETQLATIVKKITPATCLVEDVKVSDIQAVSITINGKRYNEYKIYESILFPLNNLPIAFPKIDLRMVKYKVAKDKNIAGTDKKVGFQVFSTKPFSLNPIELPPHPLKTQVAVGVFKLLENKPIYQLQTGKSFQYDFRIVGRGNPSAITLAEVQNDSLFDFYPPDIRQNLSRIGGVVGIDKTFVFPIIPKKAGKYRLNTYFHWIYFNAETAQYDTLRPQTVVSISGQTMEDTGDLPSEKSIYDGLEQKSSLEADFDYKTWVKNLANFFTVLMLLGMIYVFWKSKT